MLAILQDLHIGHGDLNLLKQVKDYIPKNRQNLHEYVTKQPSAERLKNPSMKICRFFGILILYLLHRFKSPCQYANPESIANIKKKLLKNSMVKEIFYQKSLVGSMNNNIEAISIVILLFCGLLFCDFCCSYKQYNSSCPSFQKVFNQNMQLVGATESFIRKPFIQKGILNGFYAAMIACALLTGVIYLAQIEIPELIEIEAENALLFGSLFISCFYYWDNNFLVKYISRRTKIFAPSYRRTILIHIFAPLNNKINGLLKRKPIPSAAKPATISSKPSTLEKPQWKVESKKDYFAFERENYILMIIGVVFIVLGFALMAGGKI